MEKSQGDNDSSSSKLTKEDRSSQGSNEIAKAIGAVFQQATNRGSDCISKIKAALSRDMGKELATISYLIPELCDFDDASTSSETFHVRTENIETSHNRWKYAFRVLTRVLTSIISPMIILIDDLQWADPMSREVLRSLITDIQNPNPFMIIGCHRSNEAYDTDELSKMISQLSETQSKYQFQIIDSIRKSCWNGKSHCGTISEHWNGYEIWIGLKNPRC